MKIGIVADDLTGAADAAAPFASRGLRCGVAFGDDPARRLCLEGYDVVALSTETRDMPGGHPEIIRSAINSAVSELKALDPSSLLCKKIDSTLRGHLSLELNAICAHAEGRIPIICPAFPAQGRTVVSRTLCVHGEQRQRVYEAFDPNIYLYSEHLELRGIRRGAEWVSRWLNKKAARRAIFFDAETDRDLATVAAAVLLNPTKWLPVGSAGLIGAIAAMGSPKPTENPRCVRAMQQFTSGSQLYICGSRSIVSRNQTSELERAAAILRVPTVREALQNIKGGSRVAIAASSDVEQDRDDVLENLFAGVEALREFPSVSVFATGGATAAALLRRSAGFSHLDILGEFEPGVVLANAVFGSSGNTHTPLVPLVLKAGAFGDARTLARIAGF